MACYLGRPVAGLLKNGALPAFRGTNISFLRHCSIAHTVKVRNTINRKREEALLGGGQKRIDAQHKKVGSQYNNETRPPS